jgi:hypothetical protein
LIRQCEEKKLLGEETWGGRPGRSAIDVVLLKRFTYLLFDLTKTGGGTFDNDAKACYDRIIGNLLMLRSQQLGMPQEPCETQTRLFADMKYHLKTKMGISDEYHTHTEDSPIFGTGQGNKPSGAYWLIISVLIIDLLRRKSRGVEFRDPELQMHIQRFIDGFVDDTTTWCNRFMSIMANDSETIKADLKRTAQWWEELLHSTGGQLELSKCFYYIIQWIFEPDGSARLAKPHEQGEPIQIRQSHSGETINIEQKDCDEAHKTLGVMQCPSSGQKAEQKRLKDKAQLLATQIQPANLTHKNAVTLNRNIYIPGMRYSLASTSMTLL